MPPVIANSLIALFSNLFHINHVSDKRQHNTKRQPIRKRHWLLGSTVVLIGSWITHTTTATITQQVQPTEPISAVEAAAEDVALEPGNAELTNQVTPAATLVKPEEQLVSRSRIIKKGESLGVIFRKEGLGYTLPHKISQHPIAKQLVSISAGKALQLKFNADQQLRQIHYPVSRLRQLIVEVENDDITDAVVQDIEYSTEQNTVSAEITSSLYEAALEAGLSNYLVMEMVQIFGWDIDFVQDIRAGDTFHVIYTEHHVNGKKAADGEILAAEFTTQGRRYRAMRFEAPDGTISYYTPEGESMLGTFLRSPVEFSRISSRFGKRKHPISKKWKAHKGVDYAAATGTPVRATADGNVVHAGTKGGYGKTIVLRHAGRFSTLYAHMNGYAKGIRSGTRVKQGQIIGYVGSTGYSTGPHLHYEFRVDGVHRNPLTYKTPKASSVPTEYKTEFDQAVISWGRELDTIQRDYQLAQLKSSVKKT